MIDLHCHLLPGIDDGPSEARDSVAIADAAFADGVTVIAATPHARDDHPAVVASQLEDRCSHLRNVLRVHEVPVRVVSGAEVDLAWALGASEQDLIDVSYGGQGTDVLVETPHGLLPPGFEDRLMDVFVRRGMRVLLAHPERSRVYQAEPRRLARLVEQGVLLQVTAQALVPGNRGASAKLARALVSEGAAHVIATDAHRAEMRASLSDALQGVGRGDQHRARWMVEDVPAAILAGQPIPAPPQGRRHRLRRRLG